MGRATKIIGEDAAAIADRMADALAPLRGTELLVTGAAGFLCSYLLDVVKELNSRGGEPCRVIAVDNHKTGLPERLEHLHGDDNFVFVSADISKPLPLECKPQWIVHGASVASPSVYRADPLATIDANVGGARQMLELARKSESRAMVCMSTSEIYGDPPADKIPTREDYNGNVSCTGPRACYDESKRLAETLCFVYWRKFGVPARVMRPFNVYGPGQRLDDKRIIPDMLTGVMENKPLVLFSDGRATRSFCYVRDAVAGMFCVLTGGENGEAYNVGNDEAEMSITDIAKTAAKLADGGALEVVHQTSGDADYLTDNPQRRRPDLTKLKSLGWSPQVTLAEGLSRTLQSYKMERAQ